MIEKKDVEGTEETPAEETKPEETSTEETKPEETPSESTEESTEKDDSGDEKVEGGDAPADLDVNVGEDVETGEAIG